MDTDSDTDSESPHGLLRGIIGVMNNITDILYSDNVRTRVYEENIYRRSEYDRIMTNVRVYETRPLSEQLDLMLGESFRAMLRDSLTNTELLLSLTQGTALPEQDNEDVIVSLTREQLEEYSTEIKCTEEYKNSASGGTRETCQICLNDYKLGDDLLQIRCRDCFHADCITEWLLNYSVKCPNCKHDQREAKNEF
jgi:Ring finger domain